MRIISLKPRWSKVMSTSVSVGASLEICEEYIGVDFAVREPVSCFCQSKENDGEAVWEDSCVEIFTNMLDRSGRYINFEFNSKGVCHAARGREREDRVELSADEYANVVRNPGKISKEGDFVRWTLSVQIPRELLGAADCDLRKSLIEGNIYKCADLAKEPHWLSAFPINTKKPDFHRPECFQDLNSPSWSS